MDLNKVLAELHAERDRLKAMIARVERMSGEGTNSRGPRARRVAPKGMSASSRRAASERMKAYWENRKRKEAEATLPAGGSGGSVS